MKKTYLFIIFVIFVSALFFILPGLSQANELDALLDRVEKLNITKNGYTLGKALTPKQKEIARKNMLKSKTKGTYKFKDGNIFVIARKNTDRVLIIYESYEKIPGEKIKDVVGDIFFLFGDPTVMAHEKVIYWAFNDKGKISAKKYKKIKDAKNKLDVLATVKLSSSVAITKKNIPEGDIYYIIASDRALEKL